RNLANFEIKALSSAGPWGILPVAVGVRPALRDALCGGPTSLARQHRLRGVAQLGERAPFGSVRSTVQIRPPRLKERSARPGGSLLPRTRPPFGSFERV